MSDPKTDRLEEGPTARTVAKEKSVLIVGDWFVDEHWAVGVHRSSSSSRTGRGHYRCLLPQDGEMRAFCGAGRSAFFLHQVKDNDEKLFGTLFGLGFWHGKDTNALRALFNPGGRAHSPYRLSDLDPATMAPDSVKLINMNDFLLRGKTDAERDKFEYTNRIIRIYRQERDENISYERFDWEPPRRPLRWRKEQLNHLGESLETILKGEGVSVIVVKDLLKGAVNNEIIRWLAEGLGKQARWYVSTKKWKPDWLKNLQTVDLRLLCIPQVSAQEATVSESDLTCWLTRSGHPSQEALRHIENLQSEVCGNRKPAEGVQPVIVVMTKDLNVLCRAPGIGGYDCIVQYKEELEPLQVPMGGASVFFPALCACMEYAERKGQNPEVSKFLMHSLQCTSDWVRSEGDRVLNPDTWDPDPQTWSPKPSLLDVSTSDLLPPKFKEERANPWDEETKAWHQATAGGTLGFVQLPSGRRELQLWRAMVEVDGYVCCESQKRNNLRNLIRGIREFSAHPDYHLACMLIAAPGAGKTFLVQRLADSANLELVRFNITHLSSRGEILGWFDTIHTKQEENPDKKLLVFIDEINTDLDGSKVYSAFLSPLEDGVYVRNGQTFPLKPSTWVFAGTKSPKEAGRDKETEKGSDFVSRLTLGLVDLNPEALPKELDLERVYVGASLLRSTYPDIRLVSEPVLAAFRDLPKKARVRDIKHFVREFSNIQYTSVTSANVPKQWPEDINSKAYEQWYRYVKDLRERKLTETADIYVVR